jgi:DNA-binding transcriptional ArsR family regulator
MLRELEAALKAAGDPTRTRILKLLEGGPLCVCQVQAVLGLAPSTVSKHLTLLRAAGLVTDRRDGRWIHYGLAVTGRDHPARGVLALLRGLKAVPVETLCALPPARRAPLRLGRSEPSRGAGGVPSGRAPIHRRGPRHA